MKSSASCAVCGFENVGFSQQKCPQCDSDLTCFQVLDKLPDEPFENKTGRKRISWLEIYIAITTTVCILFLAIIFYDFRRLESNVVNLQTTFDSFQRNNPVRESNFLTSPNQSGLKKAIEKPITPSPSKEIFFRPAKKIIETKITSKIENQGQSPRDQVNRIEFWKYRIKRRDSLWSIAKKFYGNGYYYPVLLEHNPKLGIFSIRENQRLRILYKTSRVKNIYDSLVNKEEDSIVWYYKILSNDDLPTIAKKFYNDEEMMQQIYEDNPTSSFKAGEKIKITLE